MKKYHYYIFVLFVFSLTTFIFYALWHTASKKSVHKSIPNEEINQSAIRENDVLVHSIDKNHTQDIQKSLQATIEDTNISVETEEEILARTQQIYKELTPDDYNETIQEVDIAFEALEEYTKELDIEIQNQEDEIDNIHQNSSNIPIEEEIIQELEEINIEELKEELENEQ